MTIHEFEQEIWVNAYLARLSIDQILEPIARLCGLTVLQCLVLKGICHNRFENVTDICNFTGMNQSNASAICTKLEQMGMLQKEKCLENRRKVKLIVTPKGLDCIEEMERRFECFIPILDTVTEEDKNMFYEMQKKLLDLIEHMKRIASEIK